MAFFFASNLLKRAKAARSEQRYRDAAALYEEAARLRPKATRLRVQCGHMRKEAGDLDLAEGHYLYAYEHLADDADISLQLGHFYKLKGQLHRADTFYRRAAELQPGWDIPSIELGHLRASGWNGAPAAPVPFANDALIAPARETGFEREAEALAGTGNIALLAPKLVARPPGDMLEEHREHVDVRRLGRKEPSFWGNARTLRGVEAIRGFCISRIPILEMQVLLNGMTIHRSAPKGGYRLQYERDRERVRKYVFNEWYDFSNFAPGRYGLELRLLDAEDGIRTFHDDVVIAPRLATRDFPDSDGIVDAADADPVELESKIRAAPSMVRSARRTLFPDGVRNVLVMRTDQLGDMVASIPALQRLRELVPDARIVGLLTVANADLARTLNLFDEIIVVDFPDVKAERRRLMPLQAQEELRCRLAGYEFDIGIDLAQSNVSRDLLHLSGAKLKYGTGGEDWPWMSAEIIFNTRDRWSAMDSTPHSTKVLGMIEALGALLRNSAPIIRRPDLSRALLASYGLADESRFVVLHAGARIEFSRWPGFVALARLILRHTDLKIVMISEDAGVRETLGEDLLQSDRFQFLGKRLSFDVFDALISFATVVVGNDSGPKHLASLRGTNVVTLFTARINWAEWGQENVGSIVSRRVPCQGCAIFHDAEECGKDFACIRDIRPQEVFDAVMQYV